MSLTVTALEVPARFGAIDTQLEWVEGALGSAPVGDVVLLPEACLTGYVSSAGDFSLTRFATAPLRQALTQLATKHRTTIIGPIVEAVGEQTFNTALVIGPDGIVRTSYRKRHPWYPETWATPGDLPWPRFVVNGVRASIAICFDVHFLEVEAADVLSDIDVLFFQSAWVDDEGDSRPEHLLRLAQHFGITVVNANWGPGSPLLPGQGGSMIVTPAGVQRRLQPGETRLDFIL